MKNLEQFQTELTILLRDHLGYDFVDIPTDNHKPKRLNTRFINSFDKFIRLLDGDTFVEYSIRNPKYNPEINWATINDDNWKAFLIELADMRIDTIFQVNTPVTNKDGNISIFITYKEND